MFKSILGRLFWTYAIILMLVFTSVAVTVGIFVNHFAISTHMNNVISVSQNLEYWTGSLQIEDTDYRARAAYKQLLRSWGSFLNSDIIVTNSNGEVLESTTSSADRSGRTCTYCNKRKYRKEIQHIKRFV